MSLKNLFSSAGGASSDVIETEVVSTASIRDVFEDNSCVALYRFEGDATDTSGNFNGTASNVTYGAGKFGQCAVLNGTNSVFRLPYSSFPFITLDSFSFSIWIKRNNASGAMIMCSNNLTGSVTSFISFNSSNNVVFSDGYYEHYSDLVCGNLSVGTWEHLVFTQQGDTRNVYQNGVNVGTETSSLTRSIYTYLEMFTLSVNGTFYSSFNGSADQFRIFNRALTAEEVAILYTEKKPQVSTINLIDPFGDNSAVALYKMDGNALDAGGSYNGTASGVTYEEGKLGHCAVFNGTSANINTGYNYGSLFALSLWVKTTSSGWVASSYTSDTAGGGLTVEANVAKLEFGGGDGIIRSLYGTKIVSDGTWHHIVALSNGTTGTIYVDGVLDVSSPFVHYNSSGSIYLGKRGTIANYFPGKMDQVRLFKRMLSQEEVEILYNEKPNDTIEEGLVAYYPLDINANDTAGTYEGTATGVTFDGDNAYFNGGAYITNASLLNKLMRGPYTISFWVKIPATNSGARTLLHAQDNNGVHNPLCYVGFGDTPGKYTFTLRTDSSSTLSDQTVSFSTEVYTHICVMITNSGASVYLNGKNILNSLFTPVFTDTAVGSFNLGREGQDWISYYSQHFTGYLDEVRVYERALTAQEVSDIYNYGR